LLALAPIVARLIDPAAKLATARGLLHGGRGSWLTGCRDFRCKAGKNAIFGCFTVEV
jgi:hypothetical protein